MIRELSRALKPTETTAGQADRDKHQPWFERKLYTCAVSAFANECRTPHGRGIRILQILICAGFLIASGCSQEPPEPIQPSAEEIKARRDEVLKMNPIPPPDTLEQTAAKVATVSAKLPEVYALLEEAKTKPEQVDKALEMIMELVYLVPSHREARVVFLKTCLDSYLYKEEVDEDGKFLDAYNMSVHIRSATSAAIRHPKMFGELTEEEEQLFKEIYFNRARFECLLSGGESADNFNDAIRNLMSLGFIDLERFKGEPRFEEAFTDPVTAPVLQSALAQMEISTKDVPATDTSEDEATPQPE